ncbi:MAG: DMT family transporter [Flavobacteriales bacterium]
MSQPPHPWAPAALLLLLGFVWGSSFILMKAGLFATDGSPLFPARELAALRIAIAGTVLFPISIKHFRSIHRKSWLPISVVGLIGSLIPALLFAQAQTEIPSALAGMLNALSPIWTLLIAFVVFGVKVARGQILGILIGFIGATMLVASQGIRRSLFTFEDAIPALMLVFATLCYGISVNTVRERLSHLRSYVISAISLGLVALPAWLYVLNSDLPDLVMTHPDAPKGLLAIFVLGAVGTAGALVLFNSLIQWTNALVAASVTYIIPVFATLWGIWDGEHIHPGQIAGGLVILIGVWVTNRKKR